MDCRSAGKGRKEKHDDREGQPRDYVPRLPTPDFTTFFVIKNL